MREINFKELSFNPMTMVGEDWLALTAGTENGGFNSMTCSWGHMGNIWGKPSIVVYVRPQRYTKEFMDREKYFSLSFYGEEYRKALGLCGSKSGRDIDKVKECGFTVEYGAGDTPYFAEAELVLICEKLYADELKAEKFVDPAVNGKCYPNEDWHTFYIGKIVEVLKKI